MIERLAPDVFNKFKGTKTESYCVNVDFYSDSSIPALVFPRSSLPSVRMARISGWCAHRIEELTYAGKGLSVRFQKCLWKKGLCAYWSKDRGIPVTGYPL